jgi:signal transduction histidine kinase
MALRFCPLRSGIDAFPVRDRILERELGGRVTFRARLLLAFLLIAMVPLAVVGVASRRRVSDALSSQYQQRVEALVAVIQQDIGRQDRMVSERLAAIAEAMRRDNPLRQGVLLGGASRAYVLDYAADAMRRSGLDMLQLQDSSGRIVSSGHFRNEYDLMEPALPELLVRVDGAALVTARTPEEPFLALARLDSVQLGTERLTLVGGVEVDRAFLESLGSATDVTVSLQLPGDSVQPIAATSDTAVVRQLTIDYISTGIGADGELGAGRILVAHSLVPLDMLRRSMDVWFAAAAGASALVAALMAMWLASRISRPISELADQTARLDLERLNVTFASDREDEIGALARVLDTMTHRLRASVRTLREVERRAALGDLARQVNHDIKNGLIPIRNVFRHLGEVAKEEPQKLPETFRERERTVESSVAYLEKLAATYAALYPKPDVSTCDLNVVVEQAVQGTAVPSRSQLGLQLADAMPLVGADELALRRIVENLVNNAVDSLLPEGGRVTVRTEMVQGADGRAMARITVADTGAGMTEEEIERAFGNFYTTKPQGTGLGLSIVRRLVNDLGGTLRVESRPGTGTQFFVDLPAKGGMS